ncbi:Hypothetical predicted protein, partial [Marmota monax]
MDSVRAPLKKGGKRQDQPSSVSLAPVICTHLHTHLNQISNRKRVRHEGVPGDLAGPRVHVSCGDIV